MRVFAGLLLVTFIAGCQTVTPPASPAGPSSTPEAPRPVVSSEPTEAASPAATIAPTTSPTPLPAPRPTPVPGTWNRPIVAIKDAGPPVFFAVDAAGHNHAAYGRGDKTAYATDASGTWVEDQHRFPGVEHLSPVGRESPQLAIDEGGAVHLAYTRGHIPSRDLYYATNDGGSWAERRLTRNSALDFFPAIAVDPTGEVHVLAGRTTLTPITYQGQPNWQWGPNALYHLTTASGRWVALRVPMPGGNLVRSPSMATDAGGRLHAVLYWWRPRTSTVPTRYDLIYLTNASGTWKTAVIRKGKADEASRDLYEPSNVVVDLQGRVHLAFVVWRQGASSDRALIYATNASGRWVEETVVAQKPASEFEPVFTMGSLAIDAAGAAHITYEQSGGEVVREFHATNESGTWTAEKLGPEGFWNSARMTAGADGRLRLVFWNGSLLYTTRN